MKEQNSKAKKNKINFIIPDFHNYKIAEYIITSQKKYPDIFNDGVNVWGFSGKFYGCKWNKKNTAFDNYTLKEEALRGIKEYYNSLNTSLVIIFDNEGINANDLDDEYGNLILRIFNDEKNYVICYSERLKKYIKEHYLKLKIINYDEKSSSSNSYELSIVNNNLKYEQYDNLILKLGRCELSDISWKFKHSKKDHIVNSINLRREKYNTKSSKKFSIEKSEDVFDFKNVDEYIKQGFSNFIIAGLGVYNVQTIETLVHYLYKEEHRLDQYALIYSSMLSIIEMECNEIHNYRL